MAIKFKKTIPDELYIDRFSSNNSLEINYEGPNTILVLVDKQNGIPGNCLETKDDKYNPDFSEIIEVDATKDTDVAQYLYEKYTELPEREHETVTLIDGTTYEKMTNPTLLNYYNITYDFEKKEWVWSVITVNPRSVYNEMADLYRSYINQNMDKLSANSTLAKAATTYLSKLDAFEKTGPGSIESWKISQANTAAVPLPPPQIVSAIEYTP